MFVLRRSHEVFFYYRISFGFNFKTVLIGLKHFILLLMTLLVICTRQKSLSF
jgi:hypothetical protein